MKSKTQSKINPDDIITLASRYYYYFKYVWHILSHEKFVPNWHIEYIADELQRIAIRIINRKKNDYDLIINVPPGSTKSSLVSQALIGWFWLHDPTISIIVSSYSADLSITHSLRAKEIIQSEDWLFFSDLIEHRFGAPMFLVKNTERYWENNYGGWFYATSTGGAVTGQHAHLIIRDDPLNPEQAESEAERNRCNRFNDRTLSTRKKNKENTPTITVMQRLHSDDPTGHDLEKEKEGLLVKHICLPAELSDNVKPAALRKKYKDGLLDPVRLSRETLKKEKAKLGSYGYAGQYDQNPYPKGGGKIKGEWFNYCSEKELPADIVWDLWIDGAYTKNTANDPTGFAVIGYSKRLNTMYIKHATDDWMEMPELLKFVPEYALNVGLSNRSRVYIEPKASGKSLAQLLKATHVSPVEIRSYLVQEGKEARVQVASPKVEAGRVTLVRGTWNDRFVSQLEAFPNGEHDEYCDIIGYAVEHYFGQVKPKVRRSN